ncbi:MAG: MFS transporter [Puniceicoccales bacterium]|jgi:predicted MFS family arabinose efflux permease|nr:MFS transporter [Puniceicoccales bacterium]
MPIFRSSGTDAPPVFNERLLLFILAAVQFTHVLDFMIILPLGEDLMRQFSITPAQFGQMTAVYSLSAAVVGFCAGFFMDRIPRRGTLLVLYAGFGIFTLACAIAPTFGWLVFARAMTGLCGGVASSVVQAMLADVIHPARRGRGMAIVAAAFPVAQVLGMPAGLWIGSHFGWHAAFGFLGAVALIVLAVAIYALPPVPSVRTKETPLRQMQAILTHPIHIRGFVLSAMLLFGGALVAPFMPMAMVKNGGMSKDDLSLMYFCGGIVVFFSTNLFGWLSDRFDKLYVLCGISVFTIASVTIITRWVNAPLWVTLIFTTMFFVTMSGRFAPAMSMVANSIAPQYRGGFMSVNASGQQASASLAHITAGWMIMEDANGKLVGYGNVGLVAAAAFVITLFLAAWLRAAAPWAARNDGRGGKAKWMTT